MKDIIYEKDGCDYVECISCGEEYIVGEEEGKMIDGEFNCDDCSDEE